MTADSLRIVVSADRDVYSRGDSITITLTVRNELRHPVVFEFASGQRFEVLIRNSLGETLWRWSEGKAFIQMLGREQLEPGSSLTYEAQFDGVLPAGRYTAVGSVVSTNLPLEARTDFTVR